MRNLLISCCLLLACGAMPAQTVYTLGPDSQVKDVPHGTVEKLVLPPGKYYPGTPHNYAVYTPSNAPAGPLPYMVFLDGTVFLGKNLVTATVFDNLIAEKSIPPMIVVFVDPGKLPAIRPDAQDRYERAFEYDSISDRYSHFLVEELLPAVAKQHALSANPDEHAIGGYSSGATGAFVAAWHRPDQFHRVLSLLGTYVAMKGGDTLIEHVRKTEAKPIRMWMQDGTADHMGPIEPYGTFYAGTWPRANQTMYDALQFQGYDVHFNLGNGAHDTKQGGSELPESLRWLWRDYSADKGVGKIEVHPPAALGKEGWDARGSVWATVDAVGNWEAVREPLPDSETIAVNKMHYVADGLGHIRWAATPKVGAAAKAVSSPAPQSKAIAFSPDQAMLIVTDPEHRMQWSMQLQSDGAPANPEPYFRLEAFDDDGGATGAAVDSTGQVYFATKIGIQVFDPYGRGAMILNGPAANKPVESIVFGGPDRDWLYVVADGKVYRRKMKVHAVPVDKPMKPPPPW
jgi:gluconolactonase